MSVLLTGAGHLGDFQQGDTVIFPFNTHQANGTPIAMAGSPTVRVYKDDGTTEDDSGITLNEAFDGITGLAVVKISLPSDPTFYSNGGQFFAKLNAGTVDGVSQVGAVLATFTIGMGVSARALDNDEQSLADLKDFADSGYDPSTNKVQGVVLLDSVGAAVETSMVAAVHEEIENTARPEQPQGTPAADASLGEKIDYNFQWNRNRHTLNKTTGQESFYGDDASTVNQKRTAADDGTTASKTEMVTGP